MLTSQLCVEGPTDGYAKHQNLGSRYCKMLEDYRSPNRSCLLEVQKWGLK